MPERVRLNINDLDGNSSALIAGFRAAAEEQGWEEEEIDRVIDEAKDSDYEHLLEVLNANIEPDYQFYDNDYDEIDGEIEEDDFLYDGNQNEKMEFNFDED